MFGFEDVLCGLFIVVLNPFIKFPSPITWRQWILLALLLPLFNLIFNWVCLHVKLSFHATFFLLYLGVFITAKRAAPRNLRARNVSRKMQLWMEGVFHLIKAPVSRDQKWSKRKVPDAECLVSKIRSLPRKRIVFLRHGESCWNEMFNKGKSKIPARLLRGLLKEAVTFLSCDSCFLDSPLNSTGIKQAESLRHFLSEQTQGGPSPEADLVELLHGHQPMPDSPDRKDSTQTKSCDQESTNKSSIIVSSNLKRAMETAVVGLWDRLQATKEQVLVLSCLQEISFNVDTLALTERKRKPAFSGSLLGHGYNIDADKYFDSSHNLGNKPLMGSNGLKRMQAFCQWAFRRPEDTIIVAGHSLWFRSFFKTFLPRKSLHICKSKKMVNCGVVGFSLVKGDIETGAQVFCIDETSIQTVYGGFEGGDWRGKNVSAGTNHKEKAV